MLNLRSILVAFLFLPVLTAQAEKGADLIKASGVKGGFVVHLGCGVGDLTMQLAVGKQYLVHGLDTNSETVQQARLNLAQVEKFGTVTASAYDGMHLPYAENLVNLIVVSDAAKVSRKEMLRVLAPLGVILQKENGEWVRTAKPWPKAIDEWTHFLHGPDNNAVAQDTEVGAPRSLQWVGAPRFSRSHEEMASFSACVTTQGRLFYIVDEAPIESVRFPSEWRLVGRDAFNGVILWKRDISQWVDHTRHFRSGPVHLPRRLVAVGESVYVTLGLDKPVVKLDAATGKTLKTYAGTERTEEIIVRDKTLYLMVGNSEISAEGAGLKRRGEPAPVERRYVLALDAVSGKTLWKFDTPANEFFMPLTLAVHGKYAFVHSTGGLICLNVAKGKQIWKAPRETPSKRMAFSAPTLVVHDDVVLLADQGVAPKKGAAPAATDKINWGVHGWSLGGYARRGTNVKLTAYATSDGQKLWTCPAAEGYNSPVDVFVTGDLVWVGKDFSTGRDIRTGEVKQQIDAAQAPVGMSHNRCYRNKATSTMIINNKSGVEVLDLEKGWQSNNSWVRGTCQYGVMPSNGLIYVPPNACGCFNQVKLQGLLAMSGRQNHISEKAAKGELEKGPAYAQLANQALVPVNPQSWPMYRHDPARSGFASTQIAPKPKVEWTANVGGELTQPVADSERVYVVATQRHSVHALNAGSGKTVWTYIAGGRVDSAPTLWQGRLLFGCADGWVYCLRAKDGVLAWRFRAAPSERLITVFGQLENSWPVHGAVLVQNDTLYVVAGRNTYVDGGLRMFALNPTTGEQISTTHIQHLDAETGKQTGTEKGRSFDMEGVLADVLSGNGQQVFLKSMCFDSECKESSEQVPHLFTPTGFLGDDWYVRNYWVFGTDTGAGWGGWARTQGGTQVPAGRIMSFDSQRVVGYGREKRAAGAVGHRGNSFHLWAMDMRTAQEKEPTPKEKRRGKGKAKGMTYLWSKKIDMIARAMIQTPGQMVLAGIPDLAKRNSNELAFDNADEVQAAYSGSKGGIIRFVNTTDGTQTEEIKLGTRPVFDGLAAAHGKLFIALKDGRLQCLK